MPRCKVVGDEFIGQVFGSLKVEKYTRSQKGRSMWRCLCDCGNYTDVFHTNLSKGVTKSCGCKRTTTGSSNHRWNGVGDLSGHYVAQIRQRARNKGLQFDITKEQLWELFLLQEKKCALTGVPLAFKMSYKDVSGTVSLDRIDSTKGYVEGNVQWVHKDINKMKMDLGNDEFINWCRLVSERKVQNA